MKLNIKKVLKGSLISLAVLGMIGGSLNIPNANARRRYRTHRVYRHRARRPIYKFGYWRHYRFYRYKTGYFRNGKWIRKATRRRAKRTRRTKRVRRTKPVRRRRVRRTNKRVNRRRPRRTRRVAYRKPTYHKRRVNRNHRHIWRLYDREGHYYGSYNNYKDYEKDKQWVALADSVYDSPNPTTNKTNTTNEANTNNSTNSSKSSENTNVAQNLAEFKQQTLTDLNNDRQAHGVAPLTETPELDQFANQRAQQLKSNFSHINGSLNNGNYAENIEEDTLGTIELNDGTRETNNNGYDLANTAENDMMNHDSASNWGHRDNILDPSNTKVGIGVSYDSTDTEGCPYKLAEDFL